MKIRTLAAAVVMTAAVTPLTALNAHAAHDPDGTQRRGLCTTTVHARTDHRTTAQIQRNLNDLSTLAVKSYMTVVRTNAVTGTLVATNFDWYAARDTFRFDYRVTSYDTQCMSVIQGF